jgi:hypothetical protein
LIADECVYGAIVFRDRIRDKDKDPSFSAKQTRVEEERYSRGKARPDAWNRSRSTALRKVTPSRVPVSS